jgi:thiamine-phosphate pyrophosphorylase
MVLCYVTDRHLLPESSPSNLLHSIECAAAAGLDWIQIREKDLTARELATLTRNAISAVERAAHTGSVRPSIIVNDRIDVALATGAAGVHLSSASIPANDVVRWLRADKAPREFKVGVSCHSLAEARDAEAAGANYVFFGPIYETPSKTNFGRPQGIERLPEVCLRVSIPVFAIGGISESNACACVQAGAAGIAAIRLFQEISDTYQLRALVSRLRAID